MKRIGLLVLIGLVVGCGTEPAVAPQTDEEAAVRLTEEGWSLFEAGDHIGALTKFKDAAHRYPSFAEAYSGLGWTYAMLDSLPEGLASFDLSIDNGLSSPDPRVGRAVIHHVLSDYAQAIVAANRALTLDSTYVFVHDRSIDYYDLHLILAQSYYLLNDYADAQGEVDVVDPTNGLDPDEPASWIVGETVYKTYEEALLLKIEELILRFRTPGSALIN